MNKKTKRTVLIVSGLALASVGGILLYNHFKSIPKNGDEDSYETDSAADVASDSFGAIVTDKPNDVLAFQRWVINIKKDRSILGKGGKSGFGDDGIFGTNSKSAWLKYKNEYNAYVSKSTTSNPKNLTIDTLPSILRPIAKSLKAATFGTSDKGLDYVKYVSPQTKNIYYWFDNARFAVKSPLNQRYISSGSFVRQGKTVIADVGARKNETITKKSALEAAYTTTIDLNPSMNSSLAKNIADNLYNAMKGAGTVDNIFWSNINMVKNKVQWKQVFDAYGKKQSVDLDGWVNSDMRTVSEREKWNTYAKSVGIPLILVENSNTASSLTK